MLLCKVLCVCTGALLLSHPTNLSYSRAQDGDVRFYRNVRMRKLAAAAAAAVRVPDKL